jgi:hypothetical protein
MERIVCKRCGSENHVKHGLVQDRQRDLCMDCGCNFTNTPARGKHPAMKALSVPLYGMGNISYRMIGRLWGISRVCVCDGITAEASKLPEPTMPSDVEVANKGRIKTGRKGRSRPAALPPSAKPRQLCAFAQAFRCVFD